MMRDYRGRNEEMIMMNVNNRNSNYHQYDENENHQNYYHHQQEQRYHRNNNTSNNNNGGWQQQWQSWLNVFLLLYSLSLQLGLFDHIKSAVYGNGVVQQQQQQNGIGSEQKIIRNDADGNIRPMMMRHNYGNYDSPSPHPPYHQQQKQTQQKRQENTSSKSSWKQQQTRRKVEDDQEKEKKEKEIAAQRNFGSELFEEEMETTNNKKNQEEGEEDIITARNITINNASSSGFDAPNKNESSPGSFILKPTSSDISGIDDKSSFSSANSSSSSSSSSPSTSNLGSGYQSGFPSSSPSGTSSTSGPSGVPPSSPSPSAGTSTTTPTTTNDDHDTDANNNNLSTTTGMDAAGRLRAALLNDYDKNSFPWEWAWEQHQNNFGINAAAASTTDNNAINLKGLPVEFELNFHKVFALDIADSTADIIGWVRMKWQDPRLVWDPKDYNGLNVTWFFLSDGTSGGEVSEIFAPDIYLWNQAESMQTTFSNTYAMVTNDGTVYWSRPGRLKPTCKYEGLRNFPYDDLSCKFEFGSWMHSGLYIVPTKMNGVGFSLGGTQTSGASFAEFELVGGNVEEYVYPPFACCPGEDWPVVIYTAVFARASEPYVRSTILVNIMLNLGAFVCFWMPPASGERMGLAITSVLAAVASELVISQMFPICDEISWYNKFSLGSLAFAMFVVFENAVVLYFYFYTGKDLTPSYIKWIQNKRRSKRNKKAAGYNKFDENNEDKNNKKKQITDAQPSSSLRQEQQKQYSTDRFWEEPREAAKLEESLGSFGGKNLPTTTTNLPTTSAGGGMKKQISFEPNAVRIAAAEQNSSTTVDNDRSDSFSTTGVNSRPMNSNRQIGDNSISSQRWWFQSLKSRKDEEQINEYWQLIAGYIDEAARVSIPVFYFIFLAIVFKKK